MENSIKEDIKIVENYLANSAINEIDSNFFKNSGWETVDLEIPKSMQHILLDYKRVLKENEELNEKILDNAGIYQLGFKDGEESYIKKVKDNIEELEEELEIMKVDNMYGRYKEYGGKTK
jgi:hypothetical protein|nr:MAG TPA: hypothetical protein [Siphoviridae sp. ctvzh6]